MICPTPVNLSRYFNARSSTYDDTRHLGAANAWGNSFPAEELPFGKVMTLASVPFHMPSRGGEADNIEALGQIVELPNLPPIKGLALLCHGEMGDQALAIYGEGINGEGRRFVAVANGWLVEQNVTVQDHGYACSHLHYNDGYELPALRPVLWCWKSEWEPFPVKRLMLGINPLFHITAITCFHEQSGFDNLDSH